MPENRAILITGIAVSGWRIGMNIRDALRTPLQQTISPLLLSIDAKLNIMELEIESWAKSGQETTSAYMILSDPERHVQIVTHLQAKIVIFENKQLTFSMARTISKIMPKILKLHKASCLQANRQAVEFTANQSQTSETQSNETVTTNENEEHTQENAKATKLAATLARLSVKTQESVSIQPISICTGLPLDPNKDEFEWPIAFAYGIKKPAQAPKPPTNTTQTYDNFFPTESHVNYIPWDEIRSFYH